MKKIEKILFTNNELIKIFGNPENKKKSKPLDVLIATILSQNTNDNNSYQAYRRLKKEYSSWEKLLYTDKETVENIIKPAGLHKQKSQTILDLIEYLSKSYGKVSLKKLLQRSDNEIFSELVKIKRIGYKTVACMMLFGLGKNYCPVDTHVFRIMSRLKIFNKTENRDKIFLELSELIKNQDNLSFSLHVNLIKFGRLICKKNKPACSQCPFISICGYKNKNLDYTSVENNDKNDFILLSIV